MLPPERAVFPFRPWVRRAGASIVIVAMAASACIAGVLALVPEARYGWMGERFVWIYVAVLWIGGLKVFWGTFRSVADVGESEVVLRPLHQFRSRTIRWDSITGTEQMVGGDRLIVYYETARGMRFVALNLNLVKGRREFLQLLEKRLQRGGFVERIVDRSRYLSRGPADLLQ